MFHVERYPTISFKGTLTTFDGDKPTEVEGELTLHGVNLAGQ
jgi:polyisoprenoid-binding protein YceI